MNPKLQAIRQRIEHEDNLINQRLSALLASQAFLLTAYAISLNAPREFLHSGYEHANHLLMRFVPWAAIGCIVVLWLTLAGAIHSLTLLRKMAATATGPDDLPVHNTAWIRRLGLSAPVLVPAVFLVLWILLLPSSY